MKMLQILYYVNGGSSGDSNTTSKNIVLQDNTVGLKCIFIEKNHYKKC